MNVIEVIDARKQFGQQMVLKDVCLNCEAGKIYGIVGYNGSGKSVLFKCISGLMTLDSGTVMINGRKKKSGEILSEAGVIIEGPAYLKYKSAYENLDYLYRMTHKKDKAYLFDLIRKVGLDPESKKHVGKFSMGMKQRLGIAQALMEQNKILILDEPMNGLDKKGIGQMRLMFLELKNQGYTMLFASHNKEDIDTLCDEVYEMDAGVLTKCADK